MRFVKLYSNKKWSHRETMFLLERLEMYVSSGLPIDVACKAVAKGMKPQRKGVLESVQNSVQQGTSLSESLHHHTVLSPAVYSLIQHGESSGSLAQSLGRAHKLLEREDELIKKCLSAMAYPVVIGIFAGLLTIGLLRGVMPQIIPMLKSLHVELPLLTRMVMAISEGFISYGIYGASSILFLIVVFKILYKKSAAFKNFIHQVLMRTPLIGGMLISYHLSVFFNSLGALVESGLSASASYMEVTHSVGLLSLKSILKSRCADVERGVALSEVLAHRLIPIHATSLVSAGERSGTLGTSLVRVALVIDRDIEHSLKRMTALIEPVMMASMGCVVGAIALSIMMPIYDISKVLQK